MLIVLVFSVLIVFQMLCVLCVLRVPKVLCVLYVLIDRKRHLVSRDDLQLPWKPVYELYHEVFHSKGVKMGLKNFPRYESGSLLSV